MPPMDNTVSGPPLEVEIFFKYLAATATAVTKSEAVAAVETFFTGRCETMIRGWAKEDVEKGIEKGMLLEARENVLETLGLKFERFITPDIQEQIQRLENRRALKRLLKSAILSPNLDSFRRDMRETIDNEQRVGE